jgi:hypothetical protein
MGPREVDLPRLGKRLLRKRRTRLEEPADSRGKKSAASRAVAAERGHWGRFNGPRIEAERLHRPYEQHTPVKEVVTSRAVEAMSVAASHVAAVAST